GASNRFAHAAALAVAERPSQAYNPLFIYGGVGLGKTHLLQAIALYANTHHSHLKVKYISTKQFTNEFIESIQHRDKIAGFYKKYGNKDVLLVDDIQFLEGKEATQEEFFHTFNTLYEANRQIVISSDSPPKDLSTLEDRLRSRFGCGLITDIQSPDLETRIAILKNKARNQSVRIPDDVMELIASLIQSNIRELEGALTRVIAFSSLINRPIEVPLAEEVLKDVYPSRESRPVSAQLIQSEVCRYFNISKSDLVGSKRSQPIVYPRQIAMYITREMTDYSLPKIGEVYGGRDHTTVLHAVNKIESLIHNERDLYNQVRELISRIKRKG
ncbi:MAG: chromosomal replication initiator protein DnaA, partial [Candidatus Subteraquimicrobiales bacterium]|nr:chromosomal replication initiator protein DnaA [Candidatus Subteraquimicrobiales bacterium]